MTNVAEPQVSRQEIHDAFQELHNQLTAGYWAATTIDAKDRIKGIADAVLEVLTDLNREDFESRDEDFQAATALVRAVSPRLEKLKEDIDRIIHAVKVAAGVAQAVDKALELAVKYFKL